MSWQGENELMFYYILTFVIAIAILVFCHGTAKSAAMAFGRTMLWTNVAYLLLIIFFSHGVFLQHPFRFMLNAWVLMLVGLPLIAIEILVAVISLIVGRCQFHRSDSEGPNVSGTF